MSMRRNKVPILDKRRVIEAVKSELNNSEQVGQLLRSLKVYQPTSKKKCIMLHL